MTPGFSSLTLTSRHGHDMNYKLFFATISFFEVLAPVAASVVETLLPTYTW